MFDELLNSINIETKGQLEYCIYKLMKIYMRYKIFSYSELHNTVYAAQHCADEFRRRYLDKRECEAKKENGGIDPQIQGDW
jgi:hypothetical protein